MNDNLFNVANFPIKIIGSNNEVYEFLLHNELKPGDNRENVIIVVQTKFENDKIRHIVLGVGLIRNFKKYSIKHNLLNSLDHTGIYHYKLSRILGKTETLKRIKDTILSNKKLYPQIQEITEG